jgi:serine/threonine protein kinase/Flp pilus assembly protein TadD
MSVKCPKCHANNPDTVKFCGECGTLLRSVRGTDPTDAGPDPRTNPTDAGPDRRSGRPFEDISDLTKTIEAPKKELTTGSIFAGRYQIIEELGKGGMGKVYKVFDKEVNAKIALKLIKPEIASDNKTIERFRNELKVARDIAHKNVCRMYDLGKEEGAYYITMEYVSGEDLKSFIRRSGIVSVAKAIAIASQVCEGLSEAHRLGVVHRDLKPQNIMIDKEGNARIMDFGIARSLEAKGITGAGVIIGTPEYMSPEQIEGKETDQRSDIYSLGVVLYEMLTGVVPFEGDTPFTIGVKHKSEIPRDPKELNLQIPEDLGRVILKCLEKDKEKRFQSVKEVHSELINIDKEIPTKERKIQKLRPLTSKEITAQFRMRRTLLLPIIFISVAAIAVIIWKFVLPSLTTSVKKPPEQISVLIADFENRTGDPIFDESIEQALALSLRGASFIKSYPRASAKKIADNLDPKAQGRLEIQMAQAICRRTGTNFVIAGAIEQLDKGYTIKTWALYPDKPDKVFEISKNISAKSDVLQETNKLARTLASTLGGTKVRSSPSITTSSLEAMKAYSTALKYEGENKINEAIKEYLRAIEHDPDFGHAFGNLAVLYQNIGQIEKAKEVYEGSLARMDRMTENEKISIRCKYYLFVRNYDKAIELLNEFLEKNPKNIFALVNIALAYFYARDMAQAVEKQKQALEVNPTDTTGRYNLVWYLMGAGDFDTAEKEARYIVNVNPEYTEAFVCLALVELIQGHPLQALETYQKLEEQGSYGVSLASHGMADLALYEGRLSDAVKILEEGIVADLSAGNNEYAAYKLLALAHAHLLKGNKKLAEETAERALNESTKENILYSAALIYIHTGDEDKAKALLSKLEKVIYPEYQSYRRLLEGEMKLLTGDVSGAIHSFQEGQKILDTWLSLYALGRAYIDAGAFAEAHEAFELCFKRRGEAASILFDDIPTARYLPTIQYYLARTQEGLNSPAAVETYKTFLSIKEKSDGEPLVEDAKKRLDGLETR